MGKALSGSPLIWRGAQSGFVTRPVSYREDAMGSPRVHDLTVPIANRKAFGERLRIAMKSSGATIEALSSEIGMSTSGIKKWLYGQAEPGLNAVIQCANALGVSVQWLATGEDSANSLAAPGWQSPNLAIDPELLGRITDRILRTYKEAGVAIPSVDVGRLAAKWYGLIAEIGEDPAARSGGLIVLSNQLKADLVNPIAPSISRKRQV